MAQMITRCPACGTRFRVVPDQLRISQGWVRCGHCSDVFDAAAQLGDTQAAPLATDPETLPARPHDPVELPDPSAQMDLPAPSAPSQDWPETELLPPEDLPDPDVAPEPLAVDDAPQWLPHAPAEIPVADPVASQDVALAEYVQAQASEPAAPALADPPEAAWVPELHRASATAAVVEAEAIVAGPERLVVTLAPDAMPLPLRPAASADADAMPLPRRPAADAPRPAPPPPRVVAATPVPRAVPLDPAHAELSFLRDAAEATVVPAPVPSDARRKRMLWSVALGVALLVLLWQLAVHDRDRLAASAPGLRPVLDALCAPLGCSVQPLQRIDAIVIDGSSFHALGDSGYRLSLTLRNRAPHPVALPAIALALTDISEQAVVRRVLLPQDLGSPPQALDAYGEWSASVDLQMADNAGRARVVGYRLDPFYP